MSVFKFKTALFAIAGFVLYLSHLMLYREIGATCSTPFWAAGSFLLFMAFWIGVGTLAPRGFKNLSPWLPILILLWLPVATPAGIVLIQLFYSFKAPWMLLPFAGCLPLGLGFGIMLGTAWRNVSRLAVKQAVYSGALGYALSAFIAYPLGWLDILITPLGFIYLYVFLILIAVLLIFIRKKSIKYWLPVCGAVIIAVSLVRLERFTADRTVMSGYPGWQRLASGFSQEGQLTLLGREGKNLGTQFLLLKNRQIWQRLPEDCMRYKTNVLPLSLQANKKNLQILAIASPFSMVPAYMAALPYVGEVKAVVPEYNILDLDILRDFRLLPAPGLEVFDQEILTYLRNNNTKYDIIFFLLRDRRCSDFAKILQLCAARLNPNGILAIPETLLLVNNAEDACGRLFIDKILLPGKATVYAFSNKNLTSDLRVLEQRLAKLDTEEDKLLPPGVFSIIYSIPGKRMDSHEYYLKYQYHENRLLGNFSKLTINFQHICLLLAIALVYFSSRFFLLRRRPLSAAAILLENGMALLMLMLLLMVALALYESCFYYNFGIMLGTLTGIPAGIFCSRFKVRRLAVITSVALIFFCLLLFKHYQPYYAPFLAFVNFICGGIIIADIFAQYPVIPNRLLATHFAASALGALIVFILMLSHFELSTCVFAVILLRLPLVFSRMALGKVDFSEVK